MNDIRFTIPGMAVPYKRLSRDDNYLKTMPLSKVGFELQEKWKKITAYLKWKEEAQEISEQYEYDRKASKSLHLHVTFYFTGKKHSDIYNYWLNIADSIFDRKKYLSGSFNVEYDTVARSVVTISAGFTVPDTQETTINVDIDQMSLQELKDFAI